ncbi:MAG: AAA family ATPase [Aeromicrobium sp.]
METLTHDAVLTRVAALASAEQEQALLIVGEPGIGKSRLLETAWANSSLRPELVRVNPSASHMTLAGLSSLIAALHNGQDETYENFDLGTPGSFDEFTVTNDLIDFLRDLTLPPTLVLIDDFDRMDDESQAMVGVMVGRLGGTGVRVVATASTVEFVGARAGMPTVMLSPLTTEQVVNSVTRCTKEVDGSTLRIIANYAGGNPTVLDQQLGNTNPHQLSGESWLTLPPLLTSAAATIAQAQTTDVSSRAREVLVMASLAPLSSFAALGAIGEDVPDVLEELVGAALLIHRGQDFQVSDPRVRTALYRQLSGRERREKHAAMVGLCAPDEEYEAAWHRSFGAQRPQELRALIVAATWLVRRGRTHEAVEFAERALNWVERVEDHAVELIELCSALVARAEFDLAARYCAGAKANPAVPRQALRLATLRLIADVCTGGLTSDHEVFTLVRMHGDADPDGATRLLMLAALYRAEHWDLDDARALLGPAAELSANASDGVRHRLEVVTGILDALEGVSGDSRNEVDLSATGSSSLGLLLLQGRLLVWREQHAEARVAFSRAVNHPEAANTAWPSLANFARIDNEIAAGRFRPARAAAAGSIRLVDETNRGQPLMIFVEAWDAYSVGRVQEARSVLDSCIDLSSRGYGAGVHSRALALRGVINLLEEDFEAAVLDFRQVTATGARLLNPTLLRHWADYVESCVSSGRPKEAMGATEALEQRLLTHHSRWGELAALRCRALLLAGASSLEMFSRAIKSFGPDDSPYELGRTLKCLAQRQESMGMTGESQRSRMLAVAAFERAGADGWASRTISGVATSVDESSPLELLNDEQREIVRRVRDDQRTREIAESLHLSVRTIELRLTGIYRALGVASRAELVNLLSQ